MNPTAPIRSLKVVNRSGQEQFVDVYPPAGLGASGDEQPHGPLRLMGRNGRRARKLDKGVYEIDGLKGLYRSEDPAAP